MLAETSNNFLETLGPIYIVQYSITWQSLYMKFDICQPSFCQARLHTQQNSGQQEKNRCKYRVYTI